jgi:hypothetical protein
MRRRSNRPRFGSNLVPVKTDFVEARGGAVVPSSPSPVLVLVHALALDLPSPEARRRIEHEHERERADEDGGRRTGTRTRPRARMVPATDFRSAVLRARDLRRPAAEGGAIAMTRGGRAGRSTRDTLARAMDMLSLLVVPLLAVGGAVAVAGALRAAGVLASGDRVRQAVRVAARRRIGEVKSGEVARITGRVQSAGEPLIAPLSGRKCAYYEAIVGEQHQGGKRDLVRAAGHEFLLRDASGIALVRLEKAQILLEYGVSGTSNVLLSDRPVPGEVRAFLARNGFDEARFSQWLYWREGALVEGEIVTVVGRGRWEDASADGYRGGGGKRLVIEAPTWRASSSRTRRTWSSRGIVSQSRQQSTPPPALPALVTTFASAISSGHDHGGPSDPHWSPEAWSRVEHMVTASPSEPHP